MSALLTGVYTLTPTHVGSGEADLVVDLPVAKERHTGLPFLPGTGLKGALRALWRDRKGADEEKLFGSAPPGRSVNEAAPRPDADARATSPGGVSFGDGQLLAWPARSLNAPTVWVTSPLLVERVDRLAQAQGIAWLDANARMALDVARTQLAQKPFEAFLPYKALPTGPLVVEDLCLTTRLPDTLADTLGARFAALLPQAEPTAVRLRDGLVVISDLALQKLVKRAIPIQARVQLTDGKTTSEWKDAQGKPQTGNLWYEEVVPADTLFAAVVADREARTNLAASLWAQPTQFLQVGGNETVGQGFVWWSAATLGGARGNR